MKKRLYDKEGNLISFDIKKTLNQGLDGTIYKTDNDKCLKIFHRLLEDKTILEAIMNMKLNNFYKLYRLLYNKNQLLKGYEMQYYQNNIVNILDTNIDYTIDNMNSLYQDSDILSNNDISIQDLHSGNVILTDNRIIVIDTDRYFHSEIYDNITIRNLNRILINRLFINLYKEAINNYYPEITNEDRLQANKRINELFLTSPNGVKNKLIRYKKPIDYIRNRT